MLRQNQALLIFETNVVNRTVGQDEFLPVVRLSKLIRRNARRVNRRNFSGPKLVVEFQVDTGAPVVGIETFRDEKIRGRPLQLPGTLELNPQ